MVSLSKQRAYNGIQIGLIYYIGFKVCKYLKRKPINNLNLFVRKKDIHNLKIRFQFH